MINKPSKENFLPFSVEEKEENFLLNASLILSFYSVIKGKDTRTFQNKIPFLFYTEKEREFSFEWFINPFLL